MKILMVCLGNICRSPMAEGILKHKINENELDWKVDSAGTSAWHIGEKPDPRSIEMMRLVDIDIRDQRARAFQVSDFESFDLILTMDRDNFDEVCKRAPNDAKKEKVKMMMDFVYPNQQVSVQDPYFNNSFREVHRMLDQACDQIIEYYNKQTA